MSEVAAEGPTRRRPNVLITGTPGVGKTATASLIAVRIQSTVLPLSADGSFLTFTFDLYGKIGTVGHEALERWRNHQRKQVL
jgi:Holliday junction resolvasome RuvABC ATP-dependent DNA helicase subunit